MIDCCGATAEHHLVMFDPWSALRQYFNTVFFYSYVFCTPEVKHTEALLLQIEWRTVGICNHLLVYYSRSLLPHREDSEKRRITRWPFSTLTLHRKKNFSTLFIRERYRGYRRTRDIVISLWKFRLKSQLGYLNIGSGTNPPWIYHGMDILTIQIH